MDGDNAIALYRRNREDIDVVLIDVQMPGLDGPQTLAALQRLDPDVLACFMTGNPGRYTKEDLLDFGAAYVFNKPFRPNELAQFLKNVVLARIPWQAFQGQSTLLGGAQGFQLGLIDDDILIGGIGIAGDDGAGFDFAVHRAMFFIADALSATGMELVEVNLLAGAGGGVGFDGDGYQAVSYRSNPNQAQNPCRANRVGYVSPPVHAGVDPR